MKRIIPLLILISLIACKKKNKQTSNTTSTPLTELQQYELAVNKIKNKKFLLSYHYSAHGLWHLDTSTNHITTIDSANNIVFGDTLYFKYDSISTYTQINIGLGTILSSSEDTFFFSKIYVNPDNEKFIGLVCPLSNCIYQHNWNWHSDHDTTSWLNFLNYTNYNQAVSMNYAEPIGNSIQYYFEKDSIVLFHHYHSGGWPVEADIWRGYTVMYGKAVN